MLQLRGGLVYSCLFLLLVVPRARQVQAYSLEARGLAVPIAGGRLTWPDPEPNLVPEPQGNPVDVTGGEGYPASWLDSMTDTQGDSMGAAYEDKLGESSQGSSEALRGILTDLDEAAQEVNHETVEALQEGDRRGAPVSRGKIGAYSSVDEPGVDDKKNPNAADQNGFWKLCTEGIMAILGSMLLGMVFCCVIHLWRKRRRRIAEASASQANINTRTSDIKSWMRHSNPSEHGAQQPSRLPKKPPRQPLTPPPRPTPPKPSHLSHSAMRVLEAQLSSLGFSETEEPHPQRPKPLPRSKGLRQFHEATDLGYSKNTP